MAMTLILTRSQIQQWHQLSDSVTDAKLNENIRKAQLLDLKELLGRDFFYTVTTTPADHTDILDAKSGEHNGTQYDHVGLREVLSYFVMARLVMFGDVTFNPFGATKKKTDQGELLTIAEKKQLWHEYRQMAFQLWVEVKYFMVLTEYEGYDSCYSGVTKGGRFNITKI